MGGWPVVSGVGGMSSHEWGLFLLEQKQPQLALQLPEHNERVKITFSKKNCVWGVREGREHRQMNDNQCERVVKKTGERR